MPNFVCTIAHLRHNFHTEMSKAIPLTKDDLTDGLNGEQQEGFPQGWVEIRRKGLVSVPESSAASA